MNGGLKELLEDEIAPEVEEVAETAVPEGEETGEIEAVEEAAPEAEPEVAEQPEPEATPAPEKSETVPLAAMVAERKKRQQLEAQLRELQEQQPKPDFYADPEKYLKDTLSQHTLRMSAAMVEAQHPDFKEKLAVFLEEAAGNPLLQAELESHPHPALYAYQQAQRIEEFRQLKDVDSYKAKVRAEVEAAVRAEYEAKAKQKQALKASLPPDLTNARAARTPEPVVDESLESILKRR